MSVHVDIHTINVWPHVYHQKRNRKHETRIRFIFSLLSHYYFAVATLRSPHQPSSACAAYMFVFTVFICAHTHCTIVVLQKKQHFSWLWKIRQKRPLKLQFQALAKKSQTKKIHFLFVFIVWHKWFENVSRTFTETILLWRNIVAFLSTLNEIKFKLKIRIESKCIWNLLDFCCFLHINFHSRYLRLAPREIMLLLPLSR